MDYSIIKLESLLVSFHIRHKKKKINKNIHLYITQKIIIQMNYYYVYS